MCGRYVFAIDPKEIPEVFEQNNNVHVDNVRDADKDYKSYNIGPTNYAPVLYKDVGEDGKGNGIVVQYMRFGFFPFWANKPKQFNAYRTFNAKKETLISKSKVWSHSVSHKRCVVPVQGYYEWVHEPKSKNSKTVNKRPYYIHKKDNKRILFLAGIWSKTHVKQEGDNKDYPEELYSFAIITGPAPKQLEWLHERMPIVIEPGTKAWNEWIGVDKRNDFKQGELDGFLARYETPDLEWYEVGQSVNKISNEGPRLIQPLEETERVAEEDQELVKKELEEKGKNSQSIVGMMGKNKGKKQLKKEKEEGDPQEKVKQEEKLKQEEQEQQEIEDDKKVNDEEEEQQELEDEDEDEVKEEDADQEDADQEDADQEDVGNQDENEDQEQDEEEAPAKGNEEKQEQDLLDDDEESELPDVVEDEDDDDLDEDEEAEAYEGEDDEEVEEESEFGDGQLDDEEGLEDNEEASAGTKRKGGSPPATHTRQADKKQKK